MQDPWPSQKRVHELLEGDIQDENNNNHPDQECDEEKAPNKASQKDPTYKSKAGTSVTNKVKGKKAEAKGVDGNPDIDMVTMAQSVSSMAKFLKDTQKPSPPPVPEKPGSQVMLLAELLSTKVEKLPELSSPELMYKIDGMVLEAQEEAYEQERFQSHKGFDGFNLSPKNQDIC